MIRLFLFTLIRIILIALAVYFGFAIFKWIVKILQGPSSGGYGFPQKGDAKRAKTDYKDVHDAEYEELTGDRKKKEGDVDGNSS